MQNGHAEGGSQKSHDDAAQAKKESDAYTCGCLPIASHHRYHDRGSAVFTRQRKREQQPHLVSSGRHAGRSNLKFTDSKDPRWQAHLWGQDFLTSIAAQPYWLIIAAMFSIYACTYVVFAIIWHIVRHTTGACVLYDEDSYGFLSSYLFSTELQATIGFGTRAPGLCGISAFFVTVQNITGMILDGVWVGIIFAKVSLPRHRGRSIYLSECATIARRDGALKLMVRIADIRRSTAVDAKVRAFLYTWGGGRTTREGEHIPVRVEALEMPAIETLLLVPTVLEHAIDERSPLHGLSHEHLVARDAEIVVVFEGTSELGDSFMVRRSYLAAEIRWGHMFVPIVQRAAPGRLQHTADLAKLHNVQPQRDLPKEALAAPVEASRFVLGAQAPQGPGSVPYPTLGNNTLVISDTCTTFQDQDGLYLLFRVGDTRPGQMTEAHVRAFLYEWRADALQSRFSAPYTVQEVNLGYDGGFDRLFLRHPQVVSHRIDGSSPLRRWTPAHKDPPQRAELVVLVEGILFTNSSNVMRKAVYHMPGDLKQERRFAPIVPAKQHSTCSADRDEVDWANFHTTKTASAQVHASSEAVLTRLSQGQPAGHEAQSNQNATLVI